MMSTLLLALLLADAPPEKAKTPPKSANEAATEKDVDKEKEKADLAERLDLMKKSLKIYDLTTGQGGNSMKLHAEPLLRWNNPVSGVRDGGVFLWMLDGRPQAAVQVFQLKDGLWLHEFQSKSLARGKPFGAPRIARGRSIPKRHFSSGSIIPSVATTATPRRNRNSNPAASAADYISPNGLEFAAKSDRMSDTAIGFAKEDRF
jgi:hypothetical protein